MINAPIKIWRNEEGKTVNGPTLFCVSNIIKVITSFNEINDKAVFS